MRMRSGRAMQTAFRVRRKTLIVDLGGLRSVLSSAPRAGGITRARYILNHEVAAKPMDRDDRKMGAGARCADPARTLSRLAISLGIRDKFVCLMTAVSLADLVTVLSAAAMVGMVQVATEAKTAVLLHARVKSWTGRSGATGTGTDAVVVVSGSGPPMQYSGTHTILGELVGRVIEAAVTEGLRRYVRWHAHHEPNGV